MRSIVSNITVLHSIFNRATHAAETLSDDLNMDLCMTVKTKNHVNPYLGLRLFSLFENVTWLLKIAILEDILDVNVSRYMARLRATGADWGLDIKNNIRWMIVVTSD